MFCFFQLCESGSDIKNKSLRAVVERTGPCGLGVTERRRAMSVLRNERGRPEAEGDLDAEGCEEENVEIGWRRRERLGKERDGEVR